jgi:hypothetical protein
MLTHKVLFRVASIQGSVNRAQCCYFSIKNSMNYIQTLTNKVLFCVASVQGLC